MRVGDLCAAMDRLAPLRLAESWDNVGLLVGDEADDLTPARVLLTIDATVAVIDEAIEAECAAIVAYHPPLFASMKRVVAPSIAHRLSRSGLSVYSPHTALDAASGGTNDALADLVGMTDRRPLRAAATPAASGGREAGSLRLVTFVPAEAADKVAEALFAAGAGRIGAYRECSFRGLGEGTFFGEEGTAPRVGQAQRRETVREVKLETTLPESLALAVVQALRAAHPYEEPAFDLLRRENVEARPRYVRALGQGRIGAVAGDRRDVLARVQRGIARGTGGLLVAGPREGAARTVAVLAGSAGELLHEALDQGADVVLTGEVRHHDALAAAARGATVICTLHSNSERLALPSLADRLREELPGLEVLQSRRDADPFAFVCG
jgi:dinuclear metal center YbgI/SA1388 family protein